MKKRNEVVHTKIVLIAYLVLLLMLMEGIPLSFLGVSGDPPLDQFSTPNIIPLPRQIQSKGFTLTLNTTWKILTDTTDPECTFIAGWLRDKVYNVTGVNLQINSTTYTIQSNDRIIFLGAKSDNDTTSYFYNLSLRRNIAMPTYEEFHDQGYVLEVYNTPPRDEVVILAKTKQGVFYGVTSFVQMLSEAGVFAGVSILDFPHFQERNYHPEFNDNYWGYTDVYPQVKAIYQRDLNWTDWLASMKFNFVSGIHQMGGLFATTSPWYNLVSRFSNYSNFTNARFVSETPIMGNFKTPVYFTGLGDPNASDGELTENFYTQDEPFRINAATGQAEPMRPYVDELPSRGIYGNFETNTTGWSIGAPAYNMRWMWNSSTGQSGTHSMMLNISSGSTGWGPLLSFEAVGTIPNSNYVLTYYIKVQNFTGRLQIYGNWKTNTKLDSIYPRSMFVTESNTTGWVKQFMLLRVTNTSNRIIFYMQSPGATSGKIWIDNVTLRRLDSAMLNIVRQPHFPDDDIVVTNLSGSKRYREGIDYTVTNGLENDTVSPYFDPDGWLNTSRATPQITPTIIQQKNGGSIALGQEVLVSYNSYYIFSNGGALGHSFASGYKMKALEDPRMYDMNISDLYHSVFYTDYMKALYTRFINPSYVDAAAPKYVFLLGDEQRGMKTDSRSMHSGLSMAQIEARMINNINSALKNYDSNVTTVFYSEMVDPYSHGGYNDYQIQFGGPYGKMSDASTQGLISKNVMIENWNDFLYNIYASMNFYLNKGYKYTVDTWVNSVKTNPAPFQDEMHIIAKENRRIPYVSDEMFNIGGRFGSDAYNKTLHKFDETPEFPNGIDEQIADYFWNPRFETLSLDAFENDNESNTTLNGWTPAGNVVYCIANFTTYSSSPGSSISDIYDFWAESPNLRSVKIKGPTSSITRINYINVTPRREYILAGFVRGPTGANGPRAEIRWYDANGTLISHNITEIIMNAYSYQEFELTALSPAHAKKAIIVLTGSNNTGNSYSFDDIMLKQSISLEYNHPPTINEATYTVTAGNVLSYSIATDPDEDPLNCTAATLPSGASLSKTGVLTWTPTSNQAGDYVIPVKVADYLFTQDGFLHITVESPAQTTRGGATDEPTATGPIAEANGPYIGYVNQSIIFNASGSTDSDGNITGYRWDFTNDSTYDTNWTTSITMIHTYSHPGNYILKLQVKDNNDLTDTDTANVTIYELSTQNHTLVAHAGGPYQGMRYKPIIFNGSHSFDTNGTITNYTWTFGDNITGYEITTLHTYATIGTYQVTLTITDSNQLATSNTTLATITDSSYNNTTFNSNIQSSPWYQLSIPLIIAIIIFITVAVIIIVLRKLYYI